MNRARLPTVLLVLAVIAAIGATALVIIGSTRLSEINDVRHNGVRVQATVLQCTTDRSVACAGAFTIAKRTYEADIQGMSRSVANGTQETVLVDRANKTVAVLRSYALHPPGNAFNLEFVLAGILAAFAVFCVIMRIVVRRRQITSP